jgi:hypothetical protein
MHQPASMVDTQVLVRRFLFPKLRGAISSDGLQVGNLIRMGLVVPARNRVPKPRASATRNRRIAIAALAAAACNSAGRSRPLSSRFMARRYPLDTFALLLFSSEETPARLHEM